MARCGLNSETDILNLYASIGQLSLLYHTDILRLLAMPIEALYFHFSMIKQGMSHVK